MFGDAAAVGAAVVIVGGGDVLTVLLVSLVFIVSIFLSFLVTTVDFLLLRLFWLSGWIVLGFWF